MKIEVSNNQTNWTTAAENTDGSVYAWKNVSVAAVGKYIRITSMCDDLAINEFALQKDRRHRLCNAHRRLRQRVAAHG